MKTSKIFHLYILSLFGAFYLYLIRIYFKSTTLFLFILFLAQGLYTLLMSQKMSIRILIEYIFLELNGVIFMGMNTKNKSIGWLKGVLSNQNTQANDNGSNEELVLELNDENTNHFDEQAKNNSLEDTPKNRLPLLRDNKDKVAIDVISAVENLLNDRQLVIIKNNDLKEQLHNANETISRLKYEQSKNEELVRQKEKEIKNLEDKLTIKQMNYDQLLEDFKEYQNTSTNGFENIKYQLEKEIDKYNRLNDEFTNYKYQNLLKIKELEEKIRELEVENENNYKQYQKILEEKNKLLKTINEFTERMAFSFSTDKTIPTSSE